MAFKPLTYTERRKRGDEARQRVTSGQSAVTGRARQETAGHVPLVYTAPPPKPETAAQKKTATNRANANEQRMGGGQVAQSVQPSYLKPKPAPKNIGAAIKDFTQSHPAPIPGAAVIRPMSANERLAERLKSVPVVGSAIRGLDVLSHLTKPAADIAQEFYTPGAGLGAINAAEQAGASLVSRLAPSIGRLGSRIATDVGIGAVTGAGQSLAAHPEQGLRGAAINAGAGAAGGALFPLLGAGAKSIISRLRPSVSPAIESGTRLALPEGRVRGNANEAQTPDVITPDYQFKLPLGDEYGQANRAAATEDLRTVDEEIRQLNQKYQAKVTDEYKYLKNSMTQGVMPGQLHFDETTGDVVGRTGRQSNNELWYRQFFADKGRAPSNKELLDLARQRVENGFQVDEAGNMAPSWTDQNQFNETLSALADVKANLTKSLNQAESTQAITDARLKSNELNFPRQGEVAAVETPAGTAAEVKTPGHQPLEYRAPATPGKQQQGIRANFGTQVDSGRYSPEMQGRINNVDQTYDIAHNVDTVNRANAMLSDLDQAEADFLSNKHIQSGDNAGHTALGYRLMDMFDARGQYDKAIAISEKLAKDLTKQGQGTQAASIIKRLSPEGQLMALTRRAEKNDMKVTPADREAFKAAATAAKANDNAALRNNAVQDVLDKLEAGAKPTEDDLKVLQTTIERAKKFTGEEKPSPTAKPAAKTVEKGTRTKREKALDAFQKAEDAAWERIRARRNIGFTPGKGNELIDYAIIAANRIAKGTIKASDHVEQLVKDFGESVRPVATKIYDMAKKRVSRNPDLYEVVSKTKSAEDIVEQWARKTSTSTEDVKKIRALAESLKNLEGKKGEAADTEMQQIMNKYEKSSVWDKIQAIRYLAMLGNTGTQSLNITSNLAMAALKNSNDVLGSMLESLLKPVLKNKKTTAAFGKNPLAYTADLFNNLKVGAKANWKGINPGGLHNINELRGMSFTGKYNPLALAERTLRTVAGGADYAVYKTQFDNEIVKQAKLAARGQKPGDRAKFMRDFIASPPPEAQEIADRVGKETTFQQKNSLGDVAANAVSGLGTKGKTGKALEQVTRAVVPFIRTPLNIAETGVTMTPAGILRGTVGLITAKNPAEQRAAINNLGLGLTGTGLGALGYYLDKIGIITGANDSGNKNVDAVRDQAGKGAYRFNQSGLLRYLSTMLAGDGRAAAEKAAGYQEGDRTFNYNKLQPITFPVTLGAGLQEGAAKGGTVQGVQEAATQGFGSLLNMSAVKGIQDVITPSMSGAEGEKQLGVLNRFVESYLKSFSPSLLAQEARREDPNQRATAFNQGLKQDLSDYYKSRVPGLSQSLPARLTTLGENKTNTPGVVGQYLNPYQSDVQNYNKAAAVVAGLIDRTGDTTIAPKAPSKDISGKDKSTGEHVTKKIDPKRYEQFQRDIGTEVTKKILAIPDNATDDARVRIIGKIMDDVKKKYTNRLKIEMGIRLK